MDRELRFGVAESEEGLVSRYWTLRAMATRSDVYLACRGLAFLHVSLHGDPAYWFLRTTHGDDTKIPVPPPLAPGYFQAVEIRIPAAALDERPPVREGVFWFSAPRTPTPWWVRYHVVLEPVGADLSTWPGSDEGASLVGRVRLWDGRTACVVATVTDALEVRMTLREEQRLTLRDYVREAVEEGQRVGTIAWGPSPDAGIWILMGRVELVEAVPEAEPDPP